MEPFHDIYRKEDPPVFLSRRKRRIQDSDGPDPSKGTNPQNKDSRPEPWARHRTSERTESRVHRSRRHHSQHGNLASRILWTGAAVVVIAYVFVLAASVLRGDKKSKKSSPVATASVAAAVTPSSNAVAEAASIQERIAAWNRLPDAVLQAQTQQDRGLLDDAEAALKKALETSPNALAIQSRLARLYIEQKKCAQASELLVRVLDANPDDVPARLLLATCYDSQTNYAASLAVANWVLDVDPGSILANRIAADAYLNTDRTALAIPHLKKLVSLERENIVAQNKLGVAYSVMGEYVKAIQLFQGVLDKNAADSTTYYNLAVCYAKQSMTDQAVETLARAQALFPRDFVNTWMQSRDFDPIRNDPLFAALVSQSTKPAKAKTDDAEQEEKPAQLAPGAAQP